MEAKHSEHFRDEIRGNCSQSRNWIEEFEHESSVIPVKFTTFSQFLNAVVHSASYFFLCFTDPVLVKLQIICTYPESKHISRQIIPHASRQAFTVDSIPLHEATKILMMSADRKHLYMKYDHLSCLIRSIEFYALSPATRSGFPPSAVCKQDTVTEDHSKAAILILAENETPNAGS